MRTEKVVDTYTGEFGTTRELPQCHYPHNVRHGARPAYLPGTYTLDHHSLVSLNHHEHDAKHGQHFRARAYCMVTGRAIRAYVDNRPHIAATAVRGSSYPARWIEVGA